MLRFDELAVEPFESTPWAFNTHIHTIAYSVLPAPDVSVKTIELETPDSDFLEVEYIDLNNTKPVVVLFHGLEGSTQRPYMRHLMHTVTRAGYSAAALNLRSCGSRMNRLARTYHSGATDDFITFLQWVRQKFAGREIYAVGFSLGANTLVKSLAEEGRSHPADKAVAVSPPYDLKKNSLKMDLGFNKIYQYRFIRTMAAKAKIKRQQFPDYPQFRGSTLYEFDNQVTAPVNGFKNADDYYEQSSSGQFYEHVKKPLLILHSYQDTICSLKFAPFGAFELNPNIDTIFTSEGGHVGFFSKKPNWLNRTILAWLES